MMKIAYVELPAADPGQVGQLKDFYSQAFALPFEDWGPEYQAFRAGIDGGINGEELSRTLTPLVLFETDDIAAAEREVLEAGGRITKATFEYPGGKRFHFKDPLGNELGVMQPTGQAST